MLLFSTLAIFLHLAVVRIKHQRQTTMCYSTTNIKYIHHDMKLPCAEFM